jgi:hypothetical protein
VFLAVENLVDCIEWTTTESESSEGDNNRWALDMLAALVSVGLAALILLASGLLLLTAATLYLRSSRSNVAGRVFCIFFVIL